MLVVAIIYIVYKMLAWGRVSVRQCSGGGCNWSRVSAGRPGRETTAASHGFLRRERERKKKNRVSGLLFRDMHSNFEGAFALPWKQGQHVHFCNRRRHAPSPCSHIVPISLKNVKLSGSITNRRVTPPSPRT